MMRYCMLVYISKMVSTLLEAARYLRTAPVDGMGMELLENGRRMLAQIFSAENPVRSAYSPLLMQKGQWFLQS